MSSVDIINQVIATNGAQFDSVGQRKLCLLSPVGAEQAEYDWNPVVSNKNSTANEITETIRFVSEEFPELKVALTTNVLHIFDPTSYESMKMLCEKFNKVIKDALRLVKGTSLRRAPASTRSSTELLHHIIQMCYNHSIGDPHKLNKFYEPFSPEVYGETSFKFVQQMIEQFNLSENDVFIDLGSGIGQVVLHVAAASKCHCIGIEKADLPAAYAEKMEKKFKFWMNWFGKQHSNFTLHKGDFFDDKFSESIQSASFIFVNNYAFGPEVDHKLKSIFDNLKDGTRILSSKAFCALNFRITNRTLSDIGAILKVDEIHPRDNQSVSWTCKPVSYFLHTIDRSEMERYFEKFNKSRIKNSGRKVVRNIMPATTKKGNENFHSISSTSDSSSDQIKDEDNIPHKWTRKAWSTYCNTNQNSSSSITTTSSTCKSITTTTNEELSVKVECQSQSSTVEVEPIEIHTSSCTISQKKKSNRGRPRKVLSLEKVEEADEKEVSSRDNECNILLTDLKISNEDLDLSNSEHMFKEQHETQPRRPGRPRKDPKKPSSRRKIKGISLSNMDNLDVLHNQTVLSYSEFANTPPPGCVDQKLTSKGENVCPIPNIVFNEGAVIPGLDSLESISSPTSDKIDFPVYNPTKTHVFNSTNYVDFCYEIFHYLKQFEVYSITDEFKKKLREDIKFEQNKKDELNAELNMLNRQIYTCDQHNDQLTRKLLNELGVENYQEWVSSFKSIGQNYSNLSNEFELLGEDIEKYEKENCALWEQYTQQLLELKKANATKQLNAVPEESTSKVVNSPSPNYKEMKFKKYLMNENSSSQSSVNRSNSKPPTTDSNLSNNFAIASLPTSKQTTRDDCLKNITSELTTEPNPNNCNGVSVLVENNIDRINHIIKEALNDKSEPKSALPITQNNFVNPSKSASTLNNFPETAISCPSESKKANSRKATAPKKTRKSKVETIKTKKGRQVILTNSGGYPSTQLVRSPICKEEQCDSNANSPTRSSLHSLSSTAINAEQAYSTVQPIKLKINFKEKLVNIVNGGQQLQDMEYHSDSSNSNKRKLASDDSHSNKRKATVKKEENEEHKKRLGLAAHADTNLSETTSRPSEQVKLILSKIGDEYSSSFTSKKQSPSTSSPYSGTSSPNITAKQQSEQSATRCSPIQTIPPLKLNAAQYVRTNPDNGDTVGYNSKEILHNSSLSTDCWRSTNVASTLNNVLPVKKTRKRSSKVQKGAPTQIDYTSNGSGFATQINAANQSEKTPIANVLSNLLEKSDSIKSALNASPGINNGFNQASFESFYQMANNRNMKSAQDLTIPNRKLRDLASPNLYYEEVNALKQSIPYPYNHFSSCMLEKANHPTDLLNQAPLATHPNFDYTLNCRFDNSNPNTYTPNALHSFSSTVDSHMKKSKGDQLNQLNSTHSNGYCNSNAVFS